MARRPRLCLPGLPHLLVQGFGRPIPDELLLDAGQHLARTIQAEALLVHAWSLTPDALAVLMQPDSARDMGYLLRSFVRRLAQQGWTLATPQRYRSCPMAPDWALTAQLWVESLPVRQARVEHAESWRLSSASAHAGLEMVPNWLRSSSAYWALGNTPFDRQARWRDELAQGLSSQRLARVDASLRGQWWLGEEAALLAWLDEHGEPADQRQYLPGRPGRKQSVPK